MKTKSVKVGIFGLSYIVSGCVFGTILTILLAQFIRIENLLAWVFVHDLICSVVLFISIVVGYIRRKTGEDYVWTWPAFFVWVSVLMFWSFITAGMAKRGYFGSNSIVILSVAGLILMVAYVFNTMGYEVAKERAGKRKGAGLGLTAFDWISAFMLAAVISGIAYGIFGDGNTEFIGIVFNIALGFIQWRRIGDPDR